jgi:hypothetical protein
MLLAITRRPDSLGDIDLYVSHKQADGKWSAPVNLGPRSIRRHASCHPNSRQMANT